MDRNKDDDDKTLTDIYWESVDTNVILNALEVQNEEIQELLRQILQAVSHKPGVAVKFIGTGKVT